MEREKRPKKYSLFSFFKKEKLNEVRRENQYAIMKEINEKINTNPDLIRQAPIKTPVTRLDETKANRELDLKWTP